MVKSDNFLSLRQPPAPVEPVMVPFGEWLPDLPELDNPGAVEALNVIPTGGGYAPFFDLALVTGLTLPAAVRGAATITDKSGSPFLYAATPAGIYRRVGGAFTSVYTPTTSLYAAYQWQFITYGWNVIALHPQVPPVVADVGGGSVFTPLAGSPPIARCGARVGDFLVLGNLEDAQDPDEVRRPARIRWSAFNNIELPWVTDAATQADYNDMPSEGGAVVAIAGREYGTVFQERSISRMSYVGLPEVFAIDTVEENRGAICGGCVVDIGAFVFFIAEDGFHIWNGTNSSPIGDNKVNTYFRRRLNYAERDRIVSAVDYVNKCVAWAFPVGNGITLDEIIIYSYKENKFSHVINTYEYIMSGYTLDQSLDDLTGSIDTKTLSFDDNSFTGRAPFMTGFSSAHAYGVFNGSALAATLDTAESTGPNGTRVVVSKVRPLVDVTSAVATVQAAVRDQLIGGAVTYGGAVAQEITGECPVLAEGRYVRFRVNVPAGASWRFGTGAQVWRKSGGGV